MTSTVRMLILLRHSKSAWPQDIPDHQRPLAERGRRDAPAVGRWLSRHVPAIDFVVCSPALRARQTWELVAAQLPATPRICQDTRLYAAPAEVVREVSQELPPEASTVLLVGHNPGLEEFLTLLTGAVQIFKTSTIAVLTTPSDWAAATPGPWTLEAVATPRGG